ncbi:hypothetical protein MHUMG1_02094 [Metarhizium humberi]|uniref:Uncharacterized protein n=1 Tax=Metarhizium humberi TaxID=2596975 RepID=A0A9P8MIQ2_9HYPO|nr:hypothetical protein MHUMG1_02094 [Metarhizium humberi]
MRSTAYLTVFESAAWALTLKIIDMADIVNLDNRKDGAVWTRPSDPDLILGVDGCCFKDEHMFARCNSSSLACKSGVTPGAGWFLDDGRESRDCRRARAEGRGQRAKACQGQIMTDDGGARAMCADDIWIVVLRTEHYCYGWKGRDPGGGGAVNAPRYGVPTCTHEVPGKYRAGARDKLREAAQESQERSERRAQRDGEVVWWLCVHVPNLPIQCFECPHMLG